MRWFCLAVSLLVAVFLPRDDAAALMKAGPGVMGHGLNVKAGPATTVTGPGDTVAFTAWWGLRAYSSAQLTGATNALRVRRSSDNFEYDIKVLPSGELDVAVGSGPELHCRSTGCFVSILYDQVAGNACTGATCNWVQATAANQPEFIFNCSGTKPCIRTVNSTAIALNSANLRTPSTPVVSLSIVARRTIGSSFCTHIRQNGNNNRLIAPAGANLLQLIAPAGGSLNATAADGSWQASVGVIAGASSAINVHGTETAGTVTGNVLAGFPGGVLGSLTSTCELMEAGMVDDVALTPAQRAALVASARAAYGLP